MNVTLIAQTMTYIMVDIESDGPIPGDYSMISFGAVVVDELLNKTFYGQLRPISDKFIPEALAVSGHTRQETLMFPEAKQVMTDFSHWIKENTTDRAIFISDNNGFDWMFICWYFHHFLGNNPFGFSSQNLGSLYKGLEKDTFKNFKHLRKTTHTHHPVDDAKGNAEALVTMKKNMGLKIKF
ncbi:3'-5' exoribonuclease [Cytophagaceae bacterium YF14B1]|uniref:3'-5' exoribonuclease n=1 Tax=Xanthocytophaga flava TaxID=3048013 RepID=A0AAE3U5E3_9BACT|nr:3'-5' exoribonuclease [Xanthocytophaga flavus]MDJ1479447.1 3'-5' exoribonuclease [Xanthocytophaga flavus]